MQDSDSPVPLALSSDPDQWYQPDPYFAGYPQVYSFSDLFRMLGGVTDSMIDAYAEMFADFISMYESLKPPGADSTLRVPPQP